MAAWAKVDVLVLDDLGLQAVPPARAADLLEVIEDRSGLRSTIVTSQLPVGHWHEALGEPTVADAILDRLVHNAYRLELKGDSRRRATRAADEPLEVAPAPDAAITPDQPVTDGPGRPHRNRGGIDDPPGSPLSPATGGVPDYPQTTERR